MALEQEVNFHYFANDQVGLSIDETTDLDDVNTLIEIFATAAGNVPAYAEAEEIEGLKSFNEKYERTSPYLTHEVFRLYHTETDMMRYIKKLERRDISLAHSMIPLGSCTMKMNAASEMFALSRPEFTGIHPLAPTDQVEGYREMLTNLSRYLTEITGFAGCSFQPNSGAAGEYAGLMTIRAYLHARGQAERHVILIPASAHGTNPASCVQAGFTPVVVATDERGNTNLDDWRAKAEAHADCLAGCMITYPSTHGIFEGCIRQMCDIIHRCGGQVYMDGANMNAQVGLTNPGFIGADICHLNLHKTFANPHGGGGPGEGPICCAKHLVPYLPATDFGDNVVSASPYGSAGITFVTYGYILMMGEAGLTRATQIAILNANYLAKRLQDTYGIVYTGETGHVGHELILECRGFKAATGITETDIAKRLMDYGFHAPTLSFPVHGTLMVEPTESESLAELDRFVQALEQIYAEIKEIEDGTADRTDNVLLNAPHPQYAVTADEWTHPYTRRKAAYPLPWIEDNKFWINVARVDNGWGDRNLIASWNDEGMLG